MPRTIKVNTIWLGLIGVILMVALACSGPPEPPDTRTPTMPPRLWPYTPMICPYALA